MQNLPLTQAIAVRFLKEQLISLVQVQRSPLALASTSCFKHCDPYMLQLCPLNDKFVSGINVALRKKTSSAHQLKISVNRFYDPEHGIGLFELGSRVDGQEITNFLMHLRSDSITGDILRKCIASFDEFHKLTLSITEAPCKTNGHTTSSLGHIAKVLLRHRIRLRKVQKDYGHNQLLSALSLENYDKHHQNITKYKLTVDSLLRYSSNRAGSRQQPNQLKNYYTWVLGLTPCQQRKLKTIQAPEWFRVAVETISTPNPDGLGYTLKPEFTVSQEHTRLIETPADEGPDALFAWTDGSLSDGKMGAAAIFTEKEDFPTVANIVFEKSVRVHRPFPSSTVPELHAILLAIQNTPTNTKLTVLSDSQASLDGIRKMLENPTPREQMKIPNLSIHLAILDASKRLTHKVKFEST